ncbi:MAG: CPBP family intramembrane metalloprotease [Polyangiaceae bacterium]|nr:CPBP family intramembrane metalloprotease [Polyangiaceae bacterium]
MGRELTRGFLRNGLGPRLLRDQAKPRARRSRKSGVSFALRSAPALAADGDRSLARLVTIAYGTLGAVGAVLAYFFAGGRPLEHPRPWLDWPLLARMPLSIALGVAFAFAIVLLTRFTVLRYRWAQRLHLELQPVARRFGPKEIWLVAVLSSLGEELFFRSFLVPTIGLVVSTLLFGFLHQVRGPSRWVWAAWAGAVGLGLGALFVATGSVLGPVVAHALINGTNLGFLKTHDIVGRDDELERADVSAT